MKRGIYKAVGVYCVCDECGFHATDFRLCGSQHECIELTPGLGDYTESLLQSVGITKERYVAAKEMFGLAPTCNCDSRRDWLNRVSDWWRGEPRNN